MTYEHGRWCTQDDASDADASTYRFVHGADCYRDDTPPETPARCDFIEECNSPAAEGSKLCRFHRDLTAGKLPKYERERR